MSTVYELGPWFGVDLRQFIDIYSPHNAYKRT